MPAGSALTFARMHIVMSVDQPPTGMEAHGCSLPLHADFPVVEIQWSPSLPAHKWSVAMVIEDKCEVHVLWVLSLNVGIEISTKLKPVTSTSWLMSDIIQVQGNKQIVLQPKRE